MKKKIALIFGGEGYESEISSLGAKNIYRMIDKTRFDVLPIHISFDGEWTLSDAEGDFPTYPVLLDGKSGFLKRGEVVAVDCAIPLLHGDGGEDGVIQGALESAHIRYVGCGVAASAIACDKAAAKAAAEHLGIPVAKWLLSTGKSAPEAKAEAEKKLTYPMIIKPVGLGSSFGVSPALTEGDFQKAFESAATYSSRLIIEELVPVACEIECAVLNRGTEALYAVGKQKTDGKIYGFESKYLGVDSPKISHGTGALSDADEKTVKEYTRLLCSFLGVRHLSRVDFFLTHRGGIIFNEINTMPGMTDRSLYPTLTEDMGLSRGEFINSLLDSII